MNRCRIQGRKLKTSGFTLLEVLIALSIFAIIGLSAYRVLDTVMASQYSVQDHSEGLRRLQRSMLLLSLDIEQAVNRSVRGPYGEEMPGMISGQGDYLLELTRQGWRNPLHLPRSDLQRVAYALQSQQEDSNESDDGLSLVRHYWRVLDQAQDSEPKTQKLISDIEDLEFRFLDENGEWRNEWPPLPEVGEHNSAVSLPLAVEVLLETERYGEIKRLYQLGRLQGERL